MTPAPLIPVRFEVAYRQLTEPWLESGGSPYVDVYVAAADRRLLVSFEVDTGAAFTLLAPSDSMHLLGDAYDQIDFDTDPSALAIGGIVGALRCVARDVRLSFRTDGGGTTDITAPVLIPELVYSPRGVRLTTGTSLLGRDILRRGILTLAWSLPAELNFSSLPPTSPALR